MSYPPTPIRLNAEQATKLSSLICSSTTEHRVAFQAKIVIMASKGMGTNTIARDLETQPATVTKWRVCLPGWD